MFSRLPNQATRLWAMPWVRSLATVLLILAPFAVMARLVKVYAVDVPFNDDWTFLEDWMQWQEGKLRLGDLFSAHMEHRVTVPRMIALALHWIGGADLRWQNACTVLLLLGMGWNLTVLLLRTSGLALSSLWLPLLLMSTALYCSIQWQGLLWPILFEAYIPIFFFTLSLRVWHSPRTPVWLAFAISVLGSLAGMWSFGNGMIAWVLVPALFWTCREELTRSQRWRLTLAWLGCAIIAGLLYSLNFDNAAPSQFSYGQGHEVTAGHSMQAFIENLSQAPRFITALLGSHLSRGLHLDNMELAEAMGWLSVIAFVVVLLDLWFGRRDATRVRALAPWLLLALFSIGTAVLITAGRLWLSKSGTLAITVRYVSHAIPLTVALIALVFLAGRRWPQLRSAGMGVAGLMLALLTTQWIYGARHMQLWQQSRLQNQALLLFAQVVKSPEALGPVAADGAYVLPLALRMERLGLMHPRLLKTLQLNQFSIVRQELPQQRACFESLELKSDGSMHASGYAELPKQRPADIILLTHREGDTLEKIFAIGALESVPRYWYDSTKRDREFLAVPAYTPEWTARWSGPLTVFDTPKPGDKIDAWALDVERLRVYRIIDRRLKSVR